MKSAQLKPGRFLVAVVLFEPDTDLYLENIQLIVDLDLPVAVFDNSVNSQTRRKIQEQLAKWLSAKQVLYLSAEANVGLSAAYNKILEKAEQTTGIEGVLFLDQDSTVPLLSIRNLMTTYERVRHVSSIGVLAGVAMTGDGIPYRVYKETNSSAEIAGLTSVRLAPSSFSLIPLSAFTKVGKYYDDFFIDHIDVDFCYRCRNAGLLVAIDASAPFPHKIGNGLISLFGYPLTPISSPFRHYYQVRNIILSARRRGASHLDAVIEVSKRFVIIAIIGIMAGDLRRRYRFALRGLRDGLRNRGGRMPMETR